jgi:filamentous hemagglutinin family protein
MKQCPRLRRLVLIQLSLWLIPVAWAGNMAPSIPAIAPRTLPVAATNFLGSGSAALAATPNVKLCPGACLQIDQTSPTATLNWRSFNLGSAGTVFFNQTDAKGLANAAATTLNRVVGGGTDPSVILGHLVAPGQVYLINQNGILFGPGAQVNVGGLVASSLNMSNDVFSKYGLLGAINQGNGLPALDFFKDANGLPLASGDIWVYSGANVTAATQGHLLLAAPNVHNLGSLHAPEGQVALVAGNRVYVAVDATDATLRGAWLVAVEGSGVAENMGTLIAERGNVTLAGLTVNQAGTARATTSVNYNGSIYLLAGNQNNLGVPPTSSATPTQLQMAARKGGALTLAPNSVTEILPDLGDTSTSLDAQTFHPSSIRAVGKSVAVEGGARVSAPGGKIELSAVTDPSVLVNPDPLATIAPSADPTVGIFLAPGSVIDASGETGVQVPVTRNFVTVELRGTELQDSPLLRSGPLYGKSVVVDLRRTDANGNIPIANIAGDLAKVGRTVAERSSVGGNVSLQSEGFLAASKGSTVNVSGGSLAYTPGVAATSQLAGSDGRVYDIMSAPTGMTFNGIAGNFNLTSTKWSSTRTWGRLGGSFASLQPGYFEGKDAGSLTVRGRAVVLEGTLLGGTLAGSLQRDGTAALSSAATQPALVRGYTQLPARGQLALGDAVFPLDDVSFSAPLDSLSSSTLNSLTSQGLPSVASTARLAPDLMSSGGWGRLAVTSQGTVTLPQGTTVSAPDGASLSLTTRSTLPDKSGDIVIAGKIEIAGGSVSLSQKGPTPDPDKLNASTITLAATSAIELEGRWVNDNPALPANSPPLGPKTISGGVLTVSSDRDLLLEAGSLVDVSGGAWLSAAGKLTAGPAGSVSLQSGALKPGSTVATPALLRTDGTLLGYGLLKGGSLSIQAPAIEIGQAATTARGLWGLTPEFFAHGGFANFVLTGHDGVVIDAKSSVDLQASNPILDINALRQSSTRRLLDVASVGRLADGQRAAERITLITDRSPKTVDPPGVPRIGDVRMAAGAVIETEVGGSISIAAADSMWIDGTLSAPAGSLSLSISGAPAGGTGDPGYDPTEALWIGTHARLLAPGFAQVQTDASGLRSGAVYGGGTVTLSAANRGYLITEAGSLIDVHGISAVLDIQGAKGIGIARQATDVYGSAGAIALAAREGILLGGNLQGNPAPVAGASGGSLSVQIDRLNEVGNPNDPSGNGTGPVTYPAKGNTPAAELLDRVLIVEASGHASLAPGVSFGAPILFSSGGQTQPSDGTAYLNAMAVTSGGFDTLGLKSRNRVSFEPGVKLSMRKSLTVDTPLIEVTGATGSVALSADYMELGNLDPNPQYQTFAPPSVAGGTASLLARANFLDLAGNFGLQGLALTRLASAGDIRLSGVVTTGSILNHLDGSLLVSGSLALDAAQIYPSTLSSFSLSAANQVDIAATAPLPSQPLSVGGRLAISAPIIQQGGVLRAPLGELDLNASNALTLSGQGSVTSVSAVGLDIPFGVTQNGIAWSYFFDTARSTLITGIPAKKIRLGGPDVTIASSALVDLSGGGDVFASEFFAGPGGSKDALAASNLYAILPSLTGTAFAPFDPGYSTTSVPQEVGSLTVAGSRLLAAGTYALLPARYALVPGAIAVQIPATAVNLDIVPGQSIALAGGSLTVAAKRAFGNTGLQDSRWQGVTLLPQSVLNALSQNTVTQGSAFFSAQAARSQASPGPLPGDAGELVLSATHALALAGNVELTPTQGALAGNVSIAAQKIAVVDNPLANDPALPGYLELSADTLSALKAGDVLLGASRADSVTGTETLNVSAQSIEIRNSATHPLAAESVTLAAQQSIAVRSGAVVATTGTDQLASPVTIAFNGDGTLVRLARGGLSEVARGTNVSRAAGSLMVESGAVLNAGGGALTLDATADSTLNSGARLQAGAFSFSGSQVNLGATSAVGGLVLSNDFLAGLAGTQALSLKGYGGINVYGPVNIDLTRAANGGQLTLDAPELSNRGGASSRLAAAQITLKNTIGAAATGNPDADAGTLSMIAEGSGKSGGLLLGPGTMQVNGTDTLQILASQVIGRGQGGVVASGALTVDTPLVSAQSAAATRLAAAGAVQLIDSHNSLPTSGSSAGTAANLLIAGRTVQIGTTVLLSGGNVDVEAATGPVQLASTGVINVAGGASSFGDQTVVAPAGTVKLGAALGDVLLAAGSLIEVSAASGGNAGNLTISAQNGSLIASGQLAGHADVGTTGASIRVDVGLLRSGTAGNGLTVLDAALQQGGFLEDREVRVRTGNLVVEDLPTAVLSARKVSLSADAGGIAVTGLIDANGASGGSVALWARDNVSVDGAGRIVAAALSANGDGGKVTLGTTSGSIQLGASTQPRIQVAAGGNGRAGSVLIRAPRNAVGTDVEVGSLARQIQGSGSTVVEAVKTYQQSLIDANFSAAADADTSGFMANAGSILQRLGLASDATAHLRPGVEVQSTGTMTVTDPWNLYAAARAGDEPGALTLRAAADLLINSSINDGFASTSPNSSLSSAPSWSIRLVGGADLRAANPAAVGAGAGSVDLAGGTVVRTGTGSIQVAAAGDITIGDTNGAAAIYTAGAVAPDQTLIAGSNSPTGSGFALPVGLSRRPQYTTAGGDIEVSAGGSVLGTSAPPDVSQWLYRQGKVLASGSDGGLYFQGPNPGPQRITSFPQTSWWVNFDAFTDGIGSLGQGNVAITAGGSLANLALAIPTNARLPGGRQFHLANDITKPVIFSEGLPDASKLVELGGGQLSVHVGGNILGANVYVQKGGADLVAGGDIAGATAGSGAVLALGNASLRLDAGGSAAIDAFYNPTMAPQAAGNIGGSNPNLRTSFSTYTDSSALSVLARKGDITFNDNPLAVSLQGDGISYSVYTTFPPTVQALALNGNIIVSGSQPLSLYPAGQGNLTLVAHGSVDLSPGISMAAVDPASLPSVATPALSFVGGFPSVYFNVPFQAQPLGATVLHSRDPAAAVVVAATGDVLGSHSAVSLQLPKPLLLEAGRDISDVTVFADNLAPTDSTRLLAGRDIVFHINRDANNTVTGSSEQIDVGGPGRLTLTAGRDVDLGDSVGVVTAGNNESSALPKGGAAISIAAGLGTQAAAIRQPAYADFVDRYLDPAGAGFSAAYQSELVSYVTDLTGFVTTADHALQVFRALPAQRQDPLVREVLYAELRDSGRAHTNSGAPYDRGYTAIDTLFPTADATGHAISYLGDVSLYFSQIKTSQGGNIDFLVPGGLVNAGLANPPSGQGAKQANALGILTVQGGSVDAMTSGNFLVNSSRVFTLAGGDIMLWSSNGNIDAGRGAKSTVLVPPPVVSVDPKTGNVSTVLQLPTGGGGIGTLITEIGQPLGNVDLIAPKGSVNAGDAGIRVAGNLNIASPVVIGADNIKVGGAATGVPVADTSGLTQGLASNSVGQQDGSKSTDAVTDRLVEASREAERLTQSLRPTFVTVEVEESPEPCVEPRCHK